LAHEDAPFRGSYPLGFLLRTAAATSAACLVGFFVLRWTFSRPLGTEFGPAFYTLKSALGYLAPSLALAALATLLVASVAVWAVALFATHKLAGPLFRLQGVAEHLRRRVLVGRVHLRATDQGKPLATEVNAWVSQRTAEWAELQRCARALEEAGCRWEEAMAGRSPVDERAALTEIRNRVREIVSVAANKP
jgi:hypothetical protein